MNRLSQPVWVLIFSKHQNHLEGLLRPVVLLSSLQFRIQLVGLRRGLRSSNKLPGDPDAAGGYSTLRNTGGVIYRPGLPPELAGLTLLHVLNDPEGFPCWPSSHGDVVFCGRAGGERIHGGGVAQSLALRNCKRSVQDKYAPNRKKCPHDLCFPKVLHGMGYPLVIPAPDGPKFFGKRK